MTPELVRRVEAALAEDRTEDVRSLLAGLSATGQASILEQVAEPERDKLVGILKRDLDPESLIELDEEVLEDVLDQLDSKDIARPPPASRDRRCGDHPRGCCRSRSARRSWPSCRPRIAPRSRARWPIPRARPGASMQRSLVKMPDGWTVGQVIDHCREATDLPDDVYDIFVVDSVRAGCAARCRWAACCAPSGRCRSLEHRRSRHSLGARASADQVEVAHLFRDKNLVSCPVVDERGRLVGVIMVDDVVDVIDEEAEEDMLEDGRRRHRRHGTPRTCAPRACARVWLTVNLATAIIASLVIGQFEGAIEKIVALAVLMPIVASMGGNAGTQTVTVAVRALATGQLTAANALRFIAKEAAVGGLNGMIFALIMGARRRRLVPATGGSAP